MAVPKTTIRMTSGKMWSVTDSPKLRGDLKLNVAEDGRSRFIEVEPHIYIRFAEIESVEYPS